MKQIKGIFLFLMSVVLVAFGSQDSKNSKGLVKKLEDGTKEVGNHNELLNKNGIYKALYNKNFDFNGKS